MEENFSLVSKIHLFYSEISVIRIGSVKVRFTRRNGPNYTTVPSREEAGKHVEDEERLCCGVWPPSRIPAPAACSNNRSRISLSRNTRTNEERRNFTRSPVRHCTSEWTQLPVRPALVDCFGKRNFNFVSKYRRNAVECEQCAVAGLCCNCKCARKNVRESGVSSRESDCSIYDYDKRALISYQPLHDSTLDRFQKFRFGGDRARNNAGRRGSGGNHKKKTQRSSDKTINLKKLTDKLKQTAHRSEDQNTEQAEPSTVPVQPPEPIQELIPLKLKTDDKEDIFDGVDLKLSKPESRTIVGSYYQRSIPFRSASFSQVHYSPEDRKYIRNNCRKTGISKKNIPNVDNCATLPRTNASALSVTDENVDKPISVDDSKNFLSNYTFLGEKATTDPPDALEPEIVSEEVKPLQDDPPQSVSLIDLEPAEPLKATVTSIIAPETDKPIPQAPKRSKHKHKHRHRHCGRLYFSDENIFSPNIAENSEQEKLENSDTFSESLPPSTPPNSDNDEMDKEIQPSDDKPDELKPQNENNSGIEMFVTDWTEKEEPKYNENNSQEDLSSIEEKATALTIDTNNNSNPTEADFHCQTTPSSPEEMLKPQWPIVPRNRRLTPQTSTERDDEPEPYPRKYLFSRGDSFSETESDQGDKRSVSPANKEGRLSPLTYGNPELSDSDSRSIGTPRGLQSPVPYTKRPLRGPYLEMIVNDQKRPENKINLADHQFLENRNSQNANWFNNGRAVDDYYLRRSNTSPNSNKLNVIPLPKRKISANIPFSSPTSLSATPDEKSVIHHQRTTSSPSQLEYYPDQLGSNQHGSVPNQQLLHQLLRGSSEHSLVQDVGVDALKNMYPAPIYKVSWLFYYLPLFNRRTFSQFNASAFYLPWLCMENLQ